MLFLLGEAPPVVPYAARDFLGGDAYLYVHTASLGVRDGVADAFPEDHEQLLAHVGRDERLVALDGEGALDARRDGDFEEP